MGFVFLAALLMTTGIVLLARWPHARKGEYPPVCALCGYSLRGLQGSPCPECGSRSEHQLLDILKPVRRRLRFGWAMIVLGVLTVATWRLQAFQPPKTYILSGAVKLIPRSGQYHQIALSFIDVDGRVSSAPHEYAHISVTAQNAQHSAEALVALDEIRAEEDCRSSKVAGSPGFSSVVHGKLQNLLRNAAPKAPNSEASLDATDLLEVIGDGIESGDLWAACQSSSRFVGQQVRLVRRGSLRFTPSLLIAILVSAIVWYSGQLILIRRVVRKMTSAE